MNDTAEVYLWGTRIGIIHQDITKAYASFEYDKDFLTNKWLRAHQMTVNGKTIGIGLADLLEAGNKMGIKERRCKDIISEVSASVARFSRFAEQVGIKEKICDHINSIIAANSVKI